MVPNPLASLCWVVGRGFGADPPWAFTHHANLLTQTLPAAVFSLFFILVIGCNGGVLILESYQECPRELSSVTHPRGNEALPDWHPESVSRLFVNVNTPALSSWCRFITTFILHSIFRWCLEICDYIVAPLYVLLKGRRRSH